VTTVSVHEAKARLSELLALAETGQVVEITRHGKPIARLVAASPLGREFGRGVGTVTYAGDFELTDHEIDEMLDGPLEPEA
jgi:prevent-host-death family protein